MIKQLTIFILSSAVVSHFSSLSFFQCMVIALLIGLYNMVYTLLEQVDFYEYEGD